MADEQDSFLTLIPSKKETTKSVGSVKTYGKFNPEEVTHLAIHHTGGTNPQSALNWWKNPASGGVGAQFIIDRDGTVIESAPMTDITGHIMPSLSNNKISNKTALGIEIVAPSDKDVTPEQKEAVRKLYQDRILPAYPNIKLENILGHGELAKGYTGSHARDPKEGMSVVNYLKENLGKTPTGSVELQMGEATPTEETPDYLSLIPRQPVTQEIPEREYQPGYFNPNIVAQGERARAAGGGNLEPMVAGITDAIKSMNIEDWKKESLIANMLKYGVGSMPIVGDEAMREEGRQKLLQTGEAALGAIAHPIRTIQEIGEQEPGQFLGQMIKGGIYDAPLGLAAKPITTAAGAVVKPVLSTAGKVVEPIVESAANKFGTLQEAMQNVRKPSVTIEGANYRPDLDTQMSGVGAANVTKQNIFNQAINSATPELANDLKQQFKNKDFHLLNEDVLNAHLEADSLPIPIRLTEGQATGNPLLISEERNTRRANPQVVARLNEQNKLLKDNAFLIKEQVAPDINTVNHVADSGEIINFVNKIKESNKLATKTAYQELEAANGGKIPIDSQTFAKNANAALNIGDDVEFLPATIKNRLDAYSNGKEMNFNQFENLRTQIANESRKASRAGDGNAVHALSLVREELEKLPLIGETVELKTMADKARTAAKKDFDLERDNPLYKAVVNDKADTKDLIQTQIFGSKNKDFAKNIDLLADNPDALKYLRSGTIDYMTKSATDASGNFSTATFNKLVNNLDENGKLEALFGTDAELIRKLGRTGQRIEARPRGSYVNESNTSVAQQVGEKAKSAVENVVNVATSKTGIPVGTVARSQFKKIKENKRAQESLRPSAGTKLQDIGKE